MSTIFQRGHVNQDDTNRIAPLGELDGYSS